jgi:hypothetical protein
MADSKAANRCSAILNKIKDSAAGQGAFEQNAVLIRAKLSPGIAAAKGKQNRFETHERLRQTFGF